MKLSESIMNAVQSCWNKGHKVYIAHAVTDLDGNYIESQAFPYGLEVAVNDTNAKLVQIDVSCNACKMFEVDDESGDFVYDVGVNGRPFLGNIHPRTVLAVIDKTTGEFVWDIPVRDKPDYSQCKYRMVSHFNDEPYNRKGVDAKWAKHENNVKHGEVMGLRLVASNDSPIKAKGNGWKPEIVC